MSWPLRICLRPSFSSCLPVSCPLRICLRTSSSCLLVSCPLSLPIPWRLLPTCLIGFLLVHLKLLLLLLLGQSVICESVQRPPRVLLLVLKDYCLRYWLFAWLGWLLELVKPKPFLTGVQPDWLWHTAVSSSALNCVYFLFRCEGKTSTKACVHKSQKEKSKIEY